jgi:hypothetical protein
VVHESCFVVETWLSRQYQTSGFGKLITIDRLVSERCGVEARGINKMKVSTFQPVARFLHKVSDSAQHCRGK